MLVAMLLLLGAVVLVAVVWKFQHKLLYLPHFGFDEPVMATPPHYGITNWEMVKIDVEPEVTLTAYMMWTPAREPFSEDAVEKAKRKPTIVYFHGNAGNIGYRLDIAQGLLERVGANVLLVAYRGYRGSTGTPSEEGFIADANAAIRYVVSRGVDSKSVFVMGTSLGGAVSIAIAANPPVKLGGVAIENTFTSISDMCDVLWESIWDQVQERMHYAERRGGAVKRTLIKMLRCVSHVGVRRGLYIVVKPVVLKLRWLSLHRISTVDPSLPMLFLSSQKDELIPPEHMQVLFDKCSSKVKEMALFEEGNHNCCYMEPDWYPTVSRWIHSLHKTE